MTIFTSYLIKYWQPLFMLAVGLSAVLFIGYAQWFGNVRKKTVQWIARYIFRDKLGSEQSADSLFMVVTSFLVAIGAVWVIVAILFLAN